VKRHPLILCCVVLGLPLVLAPFHGTARAQEERQERKFSPIPAIPATPTVPSSAPEAAAKPAPAKVQGPPPALEKPPPSEQESDRPPSPEPMLQAKPVPESPAPVPPPVNRAGRPVILIDPGHGGSKILGTLADRTNSSPNNATSPGGKLEKDLTLEFSRYLKEAIQELMSRGAPVDVRLTREEDKNIDFKTRAELCNVPNTACVVSIHFNASDGKGSAIGSLAVVAAPDRNPRYAEDAAFASGLAAACSRGVQVYLPESKSRGVITDSHLHGGVGSNFFFQLARQSHLESVPKCFLEVEFIDSKVVEKALLEGDHEREKKFRRIAEEVAGYLVDFAVRGAR